MLIERVQVGQNLTNCYIAGQKKGRGVIIDPGAEPEVIIKKVEEMEITIDKIINTHGHFDHIGANKRLSQYFDIPVFIHQNEEEFLTNPRKNLSQFTGQGQQLTSPPAGGFLEEGNDIKIGDSIFKIKHTPGHSPGSIVLYNQEEKILFSGDSIFAMGIGRSDLPGGDGNQLHESIKEEILDLPADTAVYPGHGETTMLGDFKDNIWLRIGG
ncbi:MAG: MBL fold metallo-hydrolase [Halanaerobiales bacterium]